MGGFHLGMRVLHTIYSLFKRCGIVQLLSSADLGVLGTVKKVLTGGDVKKGINLHKLYEALLWTKIKYIDVSKCDKRNVVEAESCQQITEIYYIWWVKKGSQLRNLRECDS